MEVMSKRRTGPVRRWVLVDAQGRYACDANGSQFSEDLADAHVFVGRTRESEGLRMEEVTLTLSRPKD
jgi:hypothetical protein